LALSHASLADLAREKIDLSATARDVGEQLSRRDPARGVAFTVADGLVVDADRGLIRVVLENLVGNAWKFTARSAEPRVEVGATVGESGPVYFVRDNGAG